MLAIVFGTLVIALVAYAGTLTPPGSPSATSYTLGDIYARLTTNASATLAGHSLSTTTAPAPSFQTLTSIYNAIPTIDPTKVATSTTYLGVKGTLLGHLYNGTCHYTESGHDNCPLGTEFVGGSQANGGVDDFNGYDLGGVPPTGRYSTTWTTCTSGNSYCGTGDSGAAAKDTATGLVWSYPCAGSGCASWDTVTDPAVLTNNCIPGGNCDYYNTDKYYTWDNSGSDNNSLTAKQLCSSHSGWSLPTQKQLMQTYIDGSYGNLEPQGVDRHCWSATTGSSHATSAWNVNLSDGYTSNDAKSGTSCSLCPRIVEFFGDLSI